MQLYISLATYDLLNISNVTDRMSTIVTLVGASTSQYVNLTSTQVLKFFFFFLTNKNLIYEGALKNLRIFCFQSI